MRNRELPNIYSSCTKNGIFTVKSCYWLARDVMAVVGDVGSNEDYWRLVWNTQGPPKLKHFLWGAVKGNLAVKDRLVQRHVTNDATCHICGGARETIIHSLFECSAAKEIWEHSELSEHLIDSPTESFIARWKWLYGKVEGSILRRMAALMWAAWRCRNLIVFENEHPDVVICLWLVFAATTSSVVQKCPPQGCIKANVDVHVPAVGNTGLWIVFRDADGRFVLTTMKKMEASTPECVEA
ncbi:uncharacterized protein LOC110709598 [Chenopodium quinoa]|uniref:uncharacterized protein LOC110709598 n=1 Tax=Chenopodium quinoa TaxID=63459 RepID=UPI000B78B345|nr:uncharacterized protein LOC110709598 [Chenopodium quinoa]